MSLNLYSQQQRIQFTIMKSDVVPATRYNFAIIFFVALGSFTYGFNASIMGTVFGLNSFFSYFNLSLTGSEADYANTMIGGMKQDARKHQYTCDSFYFYKRVLF